MAETIALPTLRIRPMRDEDWDPVRAIYEEGIATGDATFETAPPEYAEWNAAHLPGHRFAAELDGVMAGWVALSPVSDRCAYAGVAETSIYVAHAARGRGVGRRLLEHLIAHADPAALWTLQAGIFPENTASVALHERCGCRVVGTRERLGQLHGRWRDVLLLERRAP